MTFSVCMFCVQMNEKKKKEKTSPDDAEINQNKFTNDISELYINHFFMFFFATQLSIG